MQADVITTIVSAAPTYDLVTLTVLKAEMSITDTNNDTWLASKISQVSTSIANYCNRVLPAETICDNFINMKPAGQRVLSGRFQKLQLSRYPIISIASVVKDGVTLVENTDFIGDYKRGQLLRLDSATGYPRNWEFGMLQITYEAGFATIPLDVQDATMRLVQKAFSAKSRDPMLKRTTTQGAGEKEYWVPSSGDSNLPPGVMDLLDNYRVPVSA